MSMEPKGNDMAGELQALPFVVQYRRKSDGVAWIAMAAFDHKGPAERYCATCAAESSPWEYCVVEEAARLSRSTTDAAAGWKFVPTKHDGRAGLTPEMFDAFWAAFHYSWERHGDFESVNAGYNAMLAAAPACPSLQGGAGPDEAVAWQRYVNITDPPKWVDVVADEIEEFKRLGYPIRALYTHSLGETGGAETDELVERLTAERDSLQESVWALEAKVESLSPHETCACSWDRPDDLCMHHSPKVVAAASSLAAEKLKTAELERERDETASEVVYLGNTLEASEQRVAALVGENARLTFIIHHYDLVGVGIHSPDQTDKYCIGTNSKKLTIAKRLEKLGIVTIENSPQGPLVSLRRPER